ncbi:MAG: sensor histidine kinase, partial [Planctomycetaceae bacterium]|nr:sensor histidine kinase [Planctomycetaceae bacterium]
GRNDEVQVVVADTGSGIPEKHLPHLFKRFYRVDDSRNRSLGGTGLGLAICKSIVEVHRGKIDIESQVGLGSRFIVTLPGSAAVK